NAHQNSGAGFELFRSQAEGCAAYDNMDGFLLTGSSVRNSVATQNSRDGVRTTNVAETSSVTETESQFNGQRGIFAVAPGLAAVERCRVLDNGLEGVLLQSDGCRVVDSVVQGNGGDGIEVADGDGFVIRGCQIQGNGGRGILAGGFHGLVERCSISGNTDLGIFLTGTGAMYSRSALIENTVHGNTGGIRVDARYCRIDGNFVGNNAGLELNIGGSGNLVARNVYRGNMADPMQGVSIAGGNQAAFDVTGSIGTVGAWVNLGWATVD
ncbi:MAG: right-handed parallel beta-helix repeat-containing protein, partial [Planctomycetota bacterium]|nr:right-handed parallel beta-helix repeat-containing protein [Planctomycetota bacterium]